MGVVVPILISGLSLLLPRCSLSTICPHQCRCYQQSGRSTTDCSFSFNLTQVPIDIPISTMSLLLNDNNLTDPIESDYFHRRGAGNVNWLFLNKCSIRQLGSRVFRRMTNLEWLDLSENLIFHLKRATFSDLTRLQRLSLSDNRLRKVTSRMFNGASTLESLDLSRNRISSVHVDSFYGLMKLRSIDLSSNFLIRLDVGIFRPSLSHLQLLGLRNNRWSCDCQLRSFVSWLKLKMISEPAECAFPKRFIGKTWDRMDDDDFVCGPELIENTPESEERIVKIDGNASFHCRIYSDPLPNVQWKRTDELGRRRIIVARPEKLTIGIQPIVKRPMTFDYSLRIDDIQSEDGGHYFCIASNVAKTIVQVFDLTIVSVPVKQKKIPLEKTALSTVKTLEISQSQLLSLELVLVVMIVSTVTVLILTAVLLVNFHCHHHNGVLRKRQLVPVFDSSSNGYKYQLVTDGECQQTRQIQINNSSILNDLPGNITPALKNTDDSGYPDSESPTSQNQLAGRSSHSSTSTTSCRPSATGASLSKAPLAQYDYETGRMPLKETSL